MAIKKTVFILNNTKKNLQHLICTYSFKYLSMPAQATGRSGKPGALTNEGRLKQILLIFDNTIHGKYYAHGRL